MLLGSASALFEDEAGVYDFTIATAGLGLGPTFAQLSFDASTVLTSSSTWDSAIKLDSPTDAGPLDCYLSSRDVKDGTLKWRRNVCSTSTGPSKEPTIRHAVYSDEKSNKVYTLDESGMMRVWNDSNGDLIGQLSSDRVVAPGTTPRLLKVSPNILAGVLTVVEQGEELEYAFFYKFDNNGSIEVNGSVSAASILKHFPMTTKASTPHILGIMKSANASKSYMIAAWVHTDDRMAVTSLTEMVKMEVIKTENDIRFDTKQSKKFHHSPSSKITEQKIQATTIQFYNGGVLGNKVADGEIISYSTDLKSMVESMNIVENPSYSEHPMRPLIQEGLVYSAKLAVSECNQKLVSFEYLDGETSITAFDMKDEKPKRLSLGSGAEAETWTKSPVKLIKALSCDANSMQLLAGTQSGTTVFLKFSFDEGNVVKDVKWTAEESLGSVTSAIFLDASHSTEGNTLDDDAMINRLTFSGRLLEQLNDVITFLSGGFKSRLMNLVKGNEKPRGISQKDLTFGLKKVVVALSNPFSKVFGIDTLSGGKVVWSTNLNGNATWHKIIHGGTTSRSSVHGHGMHHPHSHEILVLSQLSDKFSHSMEWSCIDGLSGRIISSDVVTMKKPVEQVLPIHTHSQSKGDCRQGAILLHADDSVTLIPRSKQSSSEFRQAIASGLFTHKIDTESGHLRSFRIQGDDKAYTIGESLFDTSKEKIINVVYPQRNEVVQTPATISGDDSLLLKYLNPHLCVIVTEATEEYLSQLENEELSKFRESLKNSVSGSEIKGKKKPLGATKAGEKNPSRPSSPIPSLFINLVDTVSGHVLHRVSHAHADLTSLTNFQSSNVPVVISENWIVYAFPNAKTRRTEIGVLTLHEGMIDKHGITAFSSPDQQMSFSSMTSPKPIVLTKTYAIAKPVSAIGVTNTRGGISSKSFFLATGEAGQIVRLDRRLLDPRRPFGEPKMSEKKEGLLQ